MARTTVLAFKGTNAEFKAWLALLLTNANGGE